jgi:hypothetical protein
MFNIFFPPASNRESESGKPPAWTRDLVFLFPDDGTYIRDELEIPS